MYLAVVEEGYSGGAGTGREVGAARNPATANPRGEEKPNAPNQCFRAARGP